MNFSLQFRLNARFEIIVEYGRGGSWHNIYIIYNGGASIILEGKTQINI